MSKIRTALTRRATAAIVATAFAATAIAAPALAEASVQPLVVTVDKAVASNALLNRDNLRPAGKTVLAMNIVATCTRIRARMVC